MSKYIIFKAEDASTEQWKQMLLAHTGALTDILAEHFDLKGDTKAIFVKPRDLKGFNNLLAVWLSEKPGLQLRGYPPDPTRTPLPPDSRPHHRPSLGLTHR